MRCYLLTATAAAAFTPLTTAMAQAMLAQRVSPQREVSGNVDLRHSIVEADCKLPADLNVVLGWYRNEDSPRFTDLYHEVDNKTWKLSLPSVTFPGAHERSALVLIVGVGRIVEEKHMAPKFKALRWDALQPKLGDLSYYCQPVGLREDGVIDTLSPGVTAVDLLALSPPPEGEKITARQLWPKGRPVVYFRIAKASCGHYHEMDRCECVLTALAYELKPVAYKAKPETSAATKRKSPEPEKQSPLLDKLNAIGARLTTIEAALHEDASKRHRAELDGLSKRIADLEAANDSLMGIVAKVALKFPKQPADPKDPDIQELAALLCDETLASGAAGPQ